MTGSTHSSPQALVARREGHRSPDCVLAALPTGAAALESADARRGAATPPRPVGGVSSDPQLSTPGETGSRDLLELREAASAWRPESRRAESCRSRRSYERTAD